jgi:hypothetical protein
MKSCQSTVTVAQEEEEGGANREARQEHELALPPVRESGDVERSRAEPRQNPKTKPAREGGEGAGKERHSTKAADQ